MNNSTATNLDICLNFYFFITYRCPVGRKGNRLNQILAAAKPLNELAIECTGSGRSARASPKPIARCCRLSLAPANAELQFEPPDWNPAPGLPVRHSARGHRFS